MTKPMSGGKRRALKTLVAFVSQSTPLMPLWPLMSWLAMPTPMMEPMRVWELEAGRPEPPGGEVPEDGRDEEGEDHGEAGAGGDLRRSSTGGG